MKIYFTYPDVGTMLPAEYQHGVGILVAVLKAAGHEAVLNYAHHEPNPDLMVEAARNAKPDLLCFSAATNQYRRAATYAALLKDALGVPTLIGGVHATLAPEEVIQNPAFDMLCVGEGEGAMAELAAAMEAGRDFSRIANLWVKRGGDVIKNQPRPLIDDLDALPFADRECFDFDWILGEQAGRASLLSGRGCPFGCAYCANEGLRALYKGKGRFVRHRGVDSILAEMRSILDDYPVKKWDFNDDIFTLDKKWVAEFCSRYRAEFKLPFDVNVRVETVDRDMLAMLKDAGCEWIRVGVESGSERVRREIMGRSMSEEMIVAVFDQARELGLRSWSFNMVGLPGETPEDAEQTYRLNERLCPDHMQVSVFNPYPGTRLYEECRERGVLSGPARDGYFLPDSTLSLPEFPPAAIGAAHQRLVRLRNRCHTRNRLVRELGGVPAVDFVELLAEAEVEAPESIFVGEDYFSWGSDTRQVLRVHPPSRARFRLRLPPGAVFRAALSMHPDEISRGGGGGVVFTVRAGRFKSRLKEILSITLDPKGREDHRGWREVEVPLARLAGKKAWIEFETRTVDPSRPDHNTVGFGFPVVVEGK